MDGAANVHGLAGLGHADDGAEAVARGVVRGQSGGGKKDDRNVLEPFVGFDDGAEVFAANVMALASMSSASGISVLRMVRASQALETTATM